MNLTEAHQLYRDAWHHWGADTQIDMLIEEMAELTQALLKTRRCGGVISPQVIEEAADVAICLDQLIVKMVDAGKQDEYMEIVCEKLERLKSTLQASKEEAEKDLSQEKPTTHYPKPVSVNRVRNL